MKFSSKIKPMKKTVLVLLAAVVLMLSAAGCKKDNTIILDENTITLEPVFTENPVPAVSNPTWHLTNKRLFVLFGYGFNDEKNKSLILEKLGESFGMDEDGGLIYPVVYPDDFRHSGRYFVSDLTAMVNDSDKELAGVLILGAPDNTNLAIARIQDFWNLEEPFPIIALFPQDDTLGIEATCDIVIDVKSDISSDSSLKEEQDLIVSDAPAIVEAAAKYMINLQGTLDKNKSLQKHVTQMFKNKTVHHYQDPETGLPSINHFIIN